MVNVTVASSDDCAEIANLHIASWQENYNTVLSEHYLTDQIYSERRAVWESRFQSPQENQIVFVAKVEQQFAGFICLFGHKHQIYGSIIDNLHVVPCYKGLGVGKALLECAANWLLANYPDVGIYLEVLEVNQKAIAFYEHLGGVFLDNSVWHTPCGNDVNEFLYGWNNPKMLLSKC